MKRVLMALGCTMFVIVCAGNSTKKDDNKHESENTATPTQSIEMAAVTDLPQELKSIVLTGDMTNVADELDCNELTIKIENDREQKATIDDNSMFKTNIEAREGEGISILCGNDVVAFFFNDGRGEQHIVAHKTHTEVAGSEINEKMLAYQDKMASLIESLYAATTEEEAEAVYNELMSYMHDFIVENSDNVLSIYALPTYSSFGATTEEQSELFAKINPKYAYLESYKTMQNTMPGADIIDLKLPNAEGEIISVADICKSGKWALIDFWATWCGPCRGEIPHLVEAYAKFAPKGLEIYGVSFDRPGSEKRWMEFIEQNNMTWINVWGSTESGGWDVAEPFGVEGIPANFLYSPEGKLVAKNLRGEDVDKILSEYIK